jgi:acyl-CoA hydrolase/ferritin
MMELKGTRTEELLKKALAAELQASFRYRCIADEARKANMRRAADIFEATANNELEHARHEYDFLGGNGDLREVIQQAIQDEAEEAARIYPEAADTAESEGFKDIATFFRRIGNVEGNHEKYLRELLANLEKDDSSGGRTVGNSATVLTLVMQPGQANPAGFVHGGELMKIMDDTAGVVAARHSGTSIVTGSVENIQFLHPVRIGDLIIVRGKITFTSHSSMEVKIEVEAESILSRYTRDRVLALSADFVMVAVDKDGKALPVPPMIITTEEEERLFAEGRERYESRKKAAS